MRTRAVGQGRFQRFFSISARVVGSSSNASEKRSLLYHTNLVKVGRGNGSRLSSASSFLVFGFALSVFAHLRSPPAAKNPDQHRRVPTAHRPLPLRMGLWTLLEGFLLLANALAILNEERFLAPKGWSFSEVSTSGGAKTLKGQIIGLIYASQYLRVPLIVLNAITILVKLISG
ncbi:Immediate early response 3-interacting 1 [Rhynchospora pubera]|uniref:Immediate early response 3-interacting 1 n=1 Tax=Rhynchospora pubera TaxID=906938 RepID=A0AAV8FHP3_9POAL|nr:Immediate early response 3-interacting 1 [Rhynchospora pubera]